ADADGSFSLPAASLAAGQAVLYQNSGAETPLPDGAVYYVLVSHARTPNVIRLADTMAHALDKQALASVAGTSPGGSLLATGLAASSGSIGVAAATNGMLVSVAVAGSVASDKPDPKVDAGAKDSSAQLAKL